MPIEWSATHHQVDAGGHHGGGVNQGGDGSWTLHSVRQPGVQWKLSGLCVGGDHQANAGHQQAFPGQQVKPGGAEKTGKLNRAGSAANDKDGEHHGDVPHNVNQKSLARGRNGRGLVAVKADERVRGVSHATPANQQQGQVVGHHQQHHGGDKQVQAGKETTVVLLVTHVTHRETMNEKSHASDGAKHGGAERIGQGGHIHSAHPRNL